MKTNKEISEMAEMEYGTEIESIRGGNPYDLQVDRKQGYIKGYQDANEDKKELLEALKLAMENYDGYKHEREYIVEIIKKYDI